MHKFLTAIHGKLLSRESLLHFHDQSREGVARVERSCREIEATFLRGCDRNNAPLIFFIPAGAIWNGALNFARNHTVRNPPDVHRRIGDDRFLVRRQFHQAVGRIKHEAKP